MHHGGVIGEPFLNPSICSVLAKAVKLFMSKPRQIAIKAAFLGSATCHLAYVLLQLFSKIMTPPTRIGKICASLNSNPNHDPARDISSAIAPIGQCSG